MRRFILGVLFFEEALSQGFFNVPLSSTQAASQTSFAQPWQSAQLGTSQMSTARAPQLGAGLGVASAGGGTSVAQDDAAIDRAYDQNKFRAFNLVINSQNEALMKQDPKKELKVHCDVIADFNTAQQQTYSNPNMGCGYKGSVGSLRVCFDENGKFSPDDCRKASIKIDVEYFAPGSDGRVDGLKRLLFHGCPADWSLMAERLAYSLLKQWGVTASLSTHANLYLNGKFLGVHAFVQAVDDLFTQEHFGDDFNRGKGGLYKEVWFNRDHSNDFTKSLKYGKNEDAFLREIMSAVDSTPLTQDAATAFFNKYFDVKSIVDLTAANTVLGNSDDWRQRHNLFWYIREDASGKKAVLIPWDYDRLNDPGASTRGAMKGQPWWTPPNSATCAVPLEDAATKGRQKALGDWSKVAYWTDLFTQLPVDVDRPVNCDKITQLMALALGTQIRQRTREFAATINGPTMDAQMATWTRQIQSSVAIDPDGPGYTDMMNEQRLLRDAIVAAANKAVQDANNGDRGIMSSASPSATGWTSSNGITFVPKSAATQSSNFVPKSAATMAAGGAFSAGPVRSASSFPATSSASSFSSPSFSATTSSWKPATTSSFPSTPAFSSFPSTTSFPSSFSSFTPAASQFSSFGSSSFGGSFASPAPATSFPSFAGSFSPVSSSSSFGGSFGSSFGGSSFGSFGAFSG